MSSSLLPSNHDEFSSKAYWDRFFKQRNNNAFEWYGEHRDMATQLRRCTSRTNNILVIGCGNSNFSFDYYADGYERITNMDFSQLVIDEMSKKNDLAGVNMAWDVADMTDMHQYRDGSFDVVFDKGALDALMSTNSAGSSAQARQMFSEIRRVLSKGGKYVCITLGEDYIFDSLVKFFVLGTAEWEMNIEAVNGNGKKKQKSPFKTFFIVITLTGGSSGSVSMSLDRYGNDLQSPVLVPAADVQEVVKAIQQHHSSQFDIGEIRLDRFQSIDLWDDAKKSGAGNGSNGSGVPRFTVIVVDAALQARRLCAVFFVPAGRESEYQFSTQDGLLQIAGQAQCKRLLAVRCNRPHTFPDMAQLQAELSPVAMGLKPLPDPACDEQIPYMQLDTTNEWETIDTGVSAVSGEYHVEEGPDDSKSDAVLRRLIFLQNQNFVQTEVRMVERRAPGGKGGSKKGGCKGKRQKGAVKTAPSSADDDSLEFDFTYLDDHHKCTLLACVLSPQVVIHGCRLNSSLAEKKKALKDLEKVVGAHSAFATEGMAAGSWWAWAAVPWACCCSATCRR